MQLLKQILITCVVPSLTFAAIDVSKLIKVTNQNDSHCAEYFSYKDSLYCSTAPLTAASANVDLTQEKQKIIFDKRLWKAVWSKISPDIATIEYIPAGDEINNWKELVTSQFIPGATISPKEYMHVFIRELQKAGFKPQIGLLYSDPREIIFEFRIISPPNMQQDELQKIVKSADGIYILHYAIKNSDMGKKAREMWMTLLRNSEIKGSK